MIDEELNHPKDYLEIPTIEPILALSSYILGHGLTPIGLSDWKSHAHLATFCSGVF
jgi:hypothetical protein